MAYSVFGNPITDDTLMAMPKYKDKTITRKDRAYEALNMKTAEDKAVNARKYVEKLKDGWGTGVCTLCLIYNATGDAVNLMTTHDWHGHIGPAPHPTHLENGQWGAFLHVKTSGAATGSEGAVVYRGQNGDGNDYDWMLAWLNPWSGSNHAYTEIRDVNHFDDSVWGVIDDKMSNSRTDHRDTWNGCLSIVSIGGDTTSVYEGILTEESLAWFNACSFTRKTISDTR